MKKIMFNDKYGLTDAVLTGRKTMTRRIINNLSDFAPRNDWFLWGSDNRGKKNIGIFRHETYKYCIYPQYQPGEVVAVAQSYKECIDEILKNWGHKTDIAILVFKKMAAWRNKMFVRADLMPHQIHITDIKVERLQDIGDEDCMRQGIKKSMWMDVSGKQLYGFGTNEDKWTSPRDAFAALIDKIGGKGTFERNPFVFAYSFELVK